MEARCISSADATGWRAALAGVPHAFAHTVECCRTFQLTTGWPTHLFTFTAENGERVVCPFSERTHEGSVDFVTPYQFSGPVGTGPAVEFRHHWKQLAGRRQAVCSYAALHPAFSNDSYYDAQDCFSSNDVYVLDLNGSTEELLRRFDRSRQQALRGYATAFKNLIHDRDALARFLVETYPSFVARVNPSRANHFGSKTLEALAEINDVEWVGAGTNGRVEAVCVFGFTPYVADYLLNVATIEGRTHSTLLLWFGILAMKERGIPALNLGGGVRRGDSIAQAKEHFRPNRFPLKAVKQIFQPDVYAQLCQSVGVDPADRGGYFPGYYRGASPE